MKKLVAIFALAGILLQTFSQVVILGSYYANKDFIAKNLCENKDKPQMHCEGKCCLKKKLAKEGKEQAPTSRNQKSEQLINLFCSDNQIIINPLVFFISSTSHFSFNDLHTSAYQHSVFHPPSA